MLAPVTTSPARRRLAVVALVLALLVQLAVLYAPSVPPVPGTQTPGLDKVVHAAVFAAVTAAALAAGLALVPVVAVGLAHAVVSELLQHLALPGRSGDPLDVLADAVGVVLGAWLARVLIRRAGPGRSGPGRRGPGPSSRR